MNNLIKKESSFLRLLLSTTSQQQKAMIKTITPKQMKAVVQIAYNVLQGNRDVSGKDINKLTKHKLVIRRFISRGITCEKRSKLFLKYLDFILLLIKTVQKDIL